MNISNKYIPQKIDVKLKSTHFDYLNKNSVLYTENAVNKGAKSWTTPYNKPKLVGHNKDKDPIGRITSYEIKKTDSAVEPPNYIELTASITDRDAIEKVMDGRYYSVSVGSRTDRVLCSECNTVLNEDGLCEHKKGTKNKQGKPIYWIIDSIEYTESSFVNEPADDYACITDINIGNGWYAFKDFLDNRESIVNILMEDARMDTNDKKLSSEARQSLPDSSFCYVVTQDGKKVRKFPAHDAAHVRNGLARLPQAKLPDSAKSKILACLKRRAKKYGIKVSDEVTVEPTFGMDEGFTPEEIKAMDEFFQQNPDFDELVEDKTPPKSEEPKDPSTMKKDELVDFVTALQKRYVGEIEVLTDKISKIEKDMADKVTILTERENETNKLIDEFAVLEAKYKSALVDSIIDLKLVTDKNLKKDEIKESLKTRTVESLIDSLTDLRTVKIVDKALEGKVKDPVNDKNSDTPVPKVEDQKTANGDPFAIFKEERSMEAE